MTAQRLQAARRGPVPRCVATHVRPAVARATHHSLSSSAVQEVEGAVHELLDAGARAVGPAFRGRVAAVHVSAEQQRMEAVAAAHGANRVDPSLNEGTFRTRLTTDLRQMELDGSTTLGRMSFNRYHPNETQAQIVELGQIKGDFEGCPQSYVITTLIKILPGGQATPGASDGLLGESVVIGTFELAGEEQPGRLLVSFSKLRLQPAEPNQLPAWLEALAPHNPTMRTTDGVLEFVFPDGAPKGHVDFSVMTRDWHVLTGSMGSMSVLQRVA